MSLSLTLGAMPVEPFVVLENMSGGGVSVAKASTLAEATPEQKPEIEPGLGQ